MNIAQTGNSIYKALRYETAALDTIRAEKITLALALATDPDATAQVTSSTVNGQSFSVRPTMTNKDRLSLLTWVCACVDRGSVISTTQISTF